MKKRRYIVIRALGMLPSSNGNGKEDISTTAEVEPDVQSQAVDIAHPAPTHLQHDRRQTPRVDIHELNETILRVGKSAASMAARLSTSMPKT